MFNKDELLESFFEELKQGEDFAKEWIETLNDEYLDKKENNEITDEDLYELTDFIVAINKVFLNNGLDNIVKWVSSVWDYEYTPEFIKDTYAFTVQYGKMTYEKYISKLDDFEKQETEALYSAILEKKCRVEIKGEMYDWDLDEYESFFLTVKRDVSDEETYSLMTCCAKIIYNRGVLIAKFYTNRGEFELAVIDVQNGFGQWECLSGEEVEDFFEDGLYNNERVIDLRKNDSKFKNMENVIPLNLS